MEQPVVSLQRGEERLAPPPRQPDVPAPPRAAGSIRRTSSIDVSWPVGQGGIARLTGRARDLLTRNNSQHSPVGEAEFTADIAPDRTILSLSTVPHRPGVAVLVGQRAGGHLRKAIAASLPDEREGGTLLHLLLDDISGASLVSGWAWSQWDPDWLADMARKKTDPQYKKAFDKEGICTGMRPGSSGLNFGASGAATDDLRSQDDPIGWHDFPRIDGASFRRARRIDLRGNEVDTHFQDSASTPTGGRCAVHEYRLFASVDPASGRLAILEAVPRVLPFPECPAAAANMKLLLGTPMADLRRAVLDHLRGTAGCTHLNDALRALADLPTLARALADMEK